ncbi:MAG TPA: glycosyltransferase family 39 protein [Chitinophagaceae bacterium]|nr:glycosyltransferase family 39 protein [Chitinophagaceae bacterium]
MKWQDTSERKGLWILLALMTAKVVLQYLLIHPSYDLHRDEYLHLDQANHLAWGFISVPPFTSWVAWVIKALGNDVFWVKFFPALFGSLTVLYVWKIVEELGGNLFARTIAAMAIVFSVILRINTLFQPNTFEIFFWTAFYFYLIRYINRKKAIDLYIMALVLALAFLNKYNVLFLGAGLLPALLVSPQRKMLASKHLWFALALFLFLIHGNIIWQIHNGIPFIRHMKELADTQLVNMSRMDFMKEQFLFFLNSIFLLVFAFFGCFRYAPFKPYRFVFLGFVISIILYIYFRAKGYYSIGLYPVLIGFGAVYFEQLTRNRNNIRVLGIAFLILVFLPFVRLAFPYMKAEKMVADTTFYRDAGLLKWEDGKEHHMQQDFADMLGWRELAYKVDSAVNTLKEKDEVLILASNYGQAGAINYYSINALHAVSFNADYLNWFRMDKRITHIVRVLDVDEDDDDPERTQERSLCDTLILAGEITNPYAREKGTKIWLMKNVKPEVRGVIEAELKSKKSKYSSD